MQSHNGGKVKRFSVFLGAIVLAIVFSSFKKEGAYFAFIKNSKR